MNTVGTLLYTWAKGRLVGTDQTGNRYFIERSPAKGARAKRWVLFSNGKEPSTVPAEWHAWLHHTADAPLDGEKKSWQETHQANLTGTSGAYLPPGHDLRGGRRDAATGDYQAWQP